MGSFRVHYEKALRVEGTVGIDWSAHSLDYGVFKKRLLFFRQRRSTIKSYLKNSPTSTIPESTLDAIIGPKVQRPPAVGADANTGVGDAAGVGYLPFVEETGSSSSLSMDIPFEVYTHATHTNITYEKHFKKRSIQRRISATERNGVSLFLTFEMDKVATFYVSQWEHLSLTLVERGPSEDLGNEILELLAHCTMNLIALRQSLIRYDAFVRTYGGTPMLVWYMKKMRKHQNSFRKILFHEELNALMDTFVNEATFDLTTFNAQWSMLQEVDICTQKAEVLASKGKLVLIDSFVYTLRHYLLLGAIEDQMLSLQPTFLDQRGRSLADEMRRMSEWRQKKFTSPDTPISTPARLTGYEMFALSLNILSAFFYCMNYYIVEPSSTMYANALGAPDYVSGLLIGMMPIAALTSAIGFAIWTNYSFRFPLIASSLLLMTGNIVYASALKYDSVWYALVGRFITGLGAPKCIIRRFMADTTPMALRTSVNAGFALAIAVGSALGPATAILLDRFDFIGWVPGYGMFVVNGMTGPGYFMATIWCTYTLVVIFTFSEPDRSGLEEQKRLEKKMEEAHDEADDGLISPSVSQTVSRTPSGSSGGKGKSSKGRGHDDRDDDLNTIFSGVTTTSNDATVRTLAPPQSATRYTKFRAFLDLITPPVRLCLGLLFAKTFTIEALVSCTSALTKNRYGWAIKQVGTLGCINGLLVVPLSITVGYLSSTYQDRALMMWLVSAGCFGMFLLIDISDLIDSSSETYNEGDPLAVNPPRYVSGYFLTYVSIQAFEGVIGSALSKVIPTALASGTYNSGLLATLVDTLGRACGDCFIALMGFVSLRQLMNLLFIPAFCVLASCIMMIRKYYDLLAV